ncbi:hypothetical protein PHPALM_30694 [Phytophthora palmivora]|uniref:Uncharacterized protein n=1 Tax=Phytophthora palmivora TaxID=4796 RepID=A0A2P4X4I2_9STRA|nr:hypothetical protein PHPALM_30694 [Phytophthora palmivora]
MATGSRIQDIEEDLSNILQDLQSQSLVQSSRVKYAITWNQWQMWCNMLGFSVLPPPQTSLRSYQLAHFGAHCWKFGWNTETKGNAASTVVAKLSHIAWHHRRRLGFTAGLSDGHKLALNGMRRQEAGTSRMSPAQSTCYRPCTTPLTSANPATALYGGLRSWGFSFYSADQNISLSGKKIYEFILTRVDISFIDKMTRPGTHLTRSGKSQSNVAGVKTTNVHDPSGFAQFTLHGFLSSIIANFFFQPRSRSAQLFRDQLCKFETFHSCTRQQRYRQVKSLHTLVLIHYAAVEHQRLLQQKPTALL